jgi:hypothetical protein
MNELRKIFKDDSYALSFELNEAYFSNFFTPRICNDKIYADSLKEINQRPLRIDEC